MPLAEDIKKLRVLALSCDWPDRMGKNDENPWDTLATRCKAGDCDVMLHLGDQVYTWANGCTEAAWRVMDILQTQKDVSPSMVRKMEMLATRKLQESYRSTWYKAGVATSLAHSSHLMIWSDNDVTNDFTVLRNPDGSQVYMPEYLQVGMSVYRMYQRKLWDPSCHTNIEGLNSLATEQDKIEEWHFHQYGPFGVFLIDMRGNRINPKGQIQDAPILSERQKKAIQDAFASPGLACMLMCAEIPFVGESPDKIQEGAKTLAFLKDHWPYCLEELTWLLEQCFGFKSAVAGREVVMLAGDIHVSVDSMISDSTTGQTIRSITTSPITNGATKFWPALEGKINDRFSYTHKAYPGQRTFCTVDLSYEAGVATADCDLVLFADTQYK